jgi:hypothetical protein
MDAIVVMMSVFLHLSEPCTALPAVETMIAQQTYQVAPFDCGSKRLEIWQRRCEDGQGYWSRPFLLVDVASQQGFYLDRFGEVHSGWHVLMNDCYIPRCGS